MHFCVKICSDVEEIKLNNGAKMSVNWKNKSDDGAGVSDDGAVKSDEGENI